MNATRTITEIKVYWDSQDRSNEGWAYEASDEEGPIDSGSVEFADDDNLDDAIDEACSTLCVGVTHDDFAKSRHDGGSGIWTADN